VAGVSPEAPLARFQWGDSQRVKKWEGMKGKGKEGKRRRGIWKG